MTAIKSVLTSKCKHIKRTQGFTSYSCLCYTKFPLPRCCQLQSTHHKRKLWNKAWTAALPVNAFAKFTLANCALLVIIKATDSKSAHCALTQAWDPIILKDSAANATWPATICNARERLQMWAMPRKHNMEVPMITKMTIVVLKNYIQKSTQKIEQKSEAYLKTRNRNEKLDPVRMLYFYHRVKGKKDF